MTVCPHDRRLDLPCPYPGCHASVGAMRFTRIRPGAEDFTRPAQELLLFGPIPRREEFMLGGLRLVIDGCEFIRWNWLPA